MQIYEAPKIKTLILLFIDMALRRFIVACVDASTGISVSLIRLCHQALIGMNLSL